MLANFSRRPSAVSGGDPVSGIYLIPLGIIIGELGE